MSIKNIIEYDIDEYKFIFKKIDNHYLIECNEPFEWLQNINMYSINKKPSPEKLLEKIKYKIGKNNTIIIEQFKQIEQSEKKDELNLKEILINKELNRISKIEEKNNNFNNNKLKKLFNDNTIKDIIINEYLKLWIRNNSTQKVEITDNIYIWNIEFYNIKKIDVIKLKLEFNSTYYPYCPPNISIQSPQLANKLDHRISNSKIFKLEYWNPTHSISNIIEKIKNILLKNAIKIDDFNININKNLYDKLLLLSSHIDDSNLDTIDIDFEKDIEKYIVKTDNKSSKNKFNGVGYRNGSTSNWKISDYEKIQETKNIELLSILNEILRLMNNLETNEIKNTISKSLLIKFLYNLFKNTTLLDMQKREDIFNICFDILQIILNDIYKDILFEKEYNLYDVFKNLYEISQISSKINSEDNNIIIKIIFIWSLIEPLYKTIDIKYKTIEINNDLNSLYKNKLKSLQFNLSDILYNYYEPYKKLLLNSKPTQICLKRISAEISTLSRELPLHKDASIFLRVNEENPRSIRALISGPVDTPYDNGLFVFDIYVPPNYPHEVPEVHFINTGGKRFNPNLYNCGKVCLSILGTYVGPSASETEKWNSTSTLYQVLISIQSQILVDKPYFNEPGWQNKFNTPQGEKASIEYNDSIRLYTLEHAIYDFLNNNKFKEFDEVIKEHFKLKKDKIIQVMNNWLNEAMKNKYMYEKIIKDITDKLEKLN
jgi:ubiquitin-protein ligase